MCSQYWSDSPLLYEGVLSALSLLTLDSGPDILHLLFRYYEPIVANNKDSLLDVSAMLLANLCVSYIMTSQVRGTAVGGVE